MVQKTPKLTPLLSLLHAKSHAGTFTLKLLFTFSLHTEYVKRESIVIAWVKKKNSLLLTNVHVLYVLEDKTSKKKFPSVCLYVRGLFMWTQFEGVSGSKQNLVGVFYVWNVGLVLKSKVISWSWSWSWFWTKCWFSQKLCGATPNLLHGKKSMRNNTKFHEYH